MLTVGSLFAGVGGFDLGLEWASMKILWRVEKEDFCLKVLERHWPRSKRYSDIKEVNTNELETVDLICGGFPCQPFSIAGKQRGKEDDRYLWPEMLRIIAGLKPRWVIGENVANFQRMGLDDAISDLESIGYTTWPVIIPACALGAWHRRDRVFIIAHSNRDRCDSGGDYKRKRPIQSHEEWNSEKGHQEWNRGEYDSRKICKDVSNPDSFGKSQQEGCQQDQRRWISNCGQESISGWEYWAAEPGVGRVANGIPDRMDRIRAIGNAVVPQIVEVIGRYIIEIERGLD